MRKSGLIVIILLSTLIFVSCQQKEAPNAKYVFLFIGDGMGISHVIAAEAFHAAVNDTMYAPLSFRRFPTAGLSNTHAANRFITGSAAAGTALATGHKTNIGRISMDTSGKVPLESIAYKAKKNGMKVGIISSVSIDHATPAVFYANQPSRKMHFEIGIDLVESDFDFFGGGGFLKPAGLSEGDSVNLYELASEQGYHYINTKEGFETLGPTDQKILFVNPEITSGASMLYAIDQPEDYITLADITAKAIECLENENGFFMMVEGGKIDWVSHANDLASVVHEVIDFSEAVEEAVKFYRQHPHETLIVVTADHETGGLGLGNQYKGYETDFGILEHQKLSGEKFSGLLSDWWRENQVDDKGFEMMMKLIEENFGVGISGVPITLKADELEEYKTLFFSYDKILQSEYEFYSEFALTSTDLLTKRCGAGWTSMSHTAVDVPVFSLGAGHDAFSGNLDNTDIPELIWRIIE